MTIRITPTNYARFLDQIDSITAGSLCIIAKEEHIQSGAIRYLFSTDISSGWSGNIDHNARRFHGYRGTTNNWERTGLGTYRLVSMTAQRNGLFRFRFTEDLRPDLP